MLVLCTWGQSQPSASRAYSKRMSTSLMHGTFCSSGLVQNQTILRRKLHTNTPKNTLMLLKTVVIMTLFRLLSVNQPMNLLFLRCSSPTGPMITQSVGSSSNKRKNRSNRCLKPRPQQMMKKVSKASWTRKRTNSPMRNYAINSQRASSQTRRSTTWVRKISINISRWA